MNGDISKSSLQDVPVSLADTPIVNLIVQRIVNKITGTSPPDTQWNTSQLAEEILDILSTYTPIHPIPQHSTQLEIDKLESSLSSLNESNYSLQSEHNATLRQLEGVEIQLKIAKHEVTVQKLRYVCK
ncbi:hypothetical protein EON65_45615 [archaeon]|nr:MAG: hypothetical protein EON65_45615 [archaeon]